MLKKNNVTNCLLMTIKKIYYSPYKLKPLASLNAKANHNNEREGALLRILFENGEFGYADCHPWEELGDLPLSEQLAKLSQLKLTSLTKKSLYFAKIDAEHRKKNISVFFNKKFPKNHLIIPYEKMTTIPNFSFVKIKFGRNIEHEINFIKSNYTKIKLSGTKLRLDFNCCLTEQQLEYFLSELSSNLDIIDFIEDPTIYSDKIWSSIQNGFAVNLAIDRKETKIYKSNIDKKQFITFFRVVIIKPANENVLKIAPFFPEQRKVFTSYMDHPLGQLCAMYEAILFYEKYPEKTEHCGFLTHNLYELNSYSKEFKIENETLIPKIGFGFGFDSLLEKEKWCPLN